MSNVTHYELDAKLAAMEAHADARLSRFEDRLEQSISEIRRDRTELRGEIGELKKDFGSKISGLKTVMIVTAIFSVIAIVLGVAAFNSTLLSNMLASSTTTWSPR